MRSQPRRARTLHTFPRCTHRSLLPAAPQGRLQQGPTPLPPPRSAQPGDGWGAAGATAGPSTGVSLFRQIRAGDVREEPSPTAEVMRSASRLQGTTPRSQPERTYTAASVSVRMISRGKCEYLRCEPEGSDYIKRFIPIH